MRYYFDLRDGNVLDSDDVGTELPDDQAAKRQAALTLVEFARERLRGLKSRKLVFEVRDVEGCDLFTVSLDFEIAEPPSRPQPAAAFRPSAT